MSQGSPFKRSWRFVQQPHTHPSNMMKEWRNSNKLWTSKSTRRPCTPFHSLWRWEPWPTSWFSIFTRWGTWRTCQHQGPYFYLISLHIRRLTFAVTSITSNPHASQRGIQGWFCHFQALSWLLSQGQGWRFLMDFQWCKGIIQSVLKPWPKAKLISPDHLLVSLKFQETMLLKKVETWKKKLSISHKFWRTLHIPLLKRVHGHPIILIIWSKGLNRCMAC